MIIDLFLLGGGPQLLSSRDDSNMRRHSLTHRPPSRRARAHGWSASTSDLPTSPSYRTDRRQSSSVVSINKIVIHTESSLVADRSNLIGQSSNSLIIPKNLPPIELENEKLVDRLKKSQFDRISRLDRLRLETCSDQQIRTGFIVFWLVSYICFASAVPKIKHYYSALCDCTFAFIRIRIIWNPFVIFIDQNVIHFPHYFVVNYNFFWIDCEYLLYLQ